MSPLSRAAVAWWRAHRPYGWDEARHLAHPTVGVRGTSVDHALAVAVADHLTVQPSLDPFPGADHDPMNSVP